MYKILSEKPNHKNTNLGRRVLIIMVYDTEP